MSAYTADPAPPTLARTFLSKPAHPKPHLKHDAKAPDLKGAIREGIQSSPDAIFRTGIVIGFSRLRRSMDDDEYGYLGEIPRFMTTMHLCRSAPSAAAAAAAAAAAVSESTKNPNTFIIHPINCTLFSPQNLLKALLHYNPGAKEHPGNLTRDQAIHLLDSVQLLPVPDFPSAVQAITHVLNTLQNIANERHQHDHDRGNGNGNSEPIMLVITGLDTLTTSVIRTSNPIKGTGVLSSLLHTLTRLSRTYAPFLSVILLNTGGLHAPPLLQAPPASVDRSHLLRGGSSEQRLAASLLPSLMLKMLDQGVDRHILVERSGAVGRGAGVGVEVVKDRVGGAGGGRCVWDGV